MSGCNGSSKSAESVAEISPAAMRGERTFKMQCSVCHNAHTTEALHGPGMKGLFRRQTLPSGTPMTEEHVRETIMNGRAMMPPLGNVLDQEQINDVIAYLKTL